jgi:hypothetical protein
MGGGGGREWSRNGVKARPCAVSHCGPAGARCPPPVSHLPQIHPPVFPLPPALALAASPASHCGPAPARTRSRCPPAGQCRAGWRADSTSSGSDRSRFRFRSPSTVRFRRRGLPRRSSRGRPSSRAPGGRWTGPIGSRRTCTRWQGRGGQAAGGCGMGADPWRQCGRRRAATG